MPSLPSRRLEERHAVRAQFRNSSRVIVEPVGLAWLALGFAALVALSAFVFVRGAHAAAGNVLAEQKISDTAGSFGGTIDDGDRLGSAAAKLGDMDGNLVPDVAIGADGDDDGGTDRGAMWVMFLDSDGTVSGTQKISDTEGSFAGALDDSDGFGMSAAGLGDLDGDGVTDMAVGAPGDDDGGTDRGAVWVLFLNANGTTKSHQKISDTIGGFSATLDDGDGFGQAVANIGDLDGDGVTDLAVGAPFDDDGGTDRGAVHILFLNTNGTVKSEAKISDLTPVFGGVLADANEFGASLAAFNDLSGDGVEDLAVGTPGDNDGGIFRGAVYVLALNTSGGVASSQKISDLVGGFTGTLNDIDRFGSSLASAADVNGDGNEDLFVGAVNDDDGGTNRGGVWVLFLNTNGTVALRRKISQTVGGFTGPLTDNDNFGASSISPKDVDGDGVADLVVGAIGDDDGPGANRGAAYVLFLDGTPGAFCGDGELDIGETCDDGNQDNGDCCDSSCMLEANGSSCADGDVCNGDETCDGAGTCVAGTPLVCDDGQPCTLDTCDPVLGCQATSGPASMCFVAEKDQLLVKDRSPDSKDLIKWQWKKGEAVDLSDVGDPASSTDYTLCIYDETSDTPVLTSDLMVPANGAWAIKNVNAVYKDTSLGFDGVKNIKIKMGSAGKTKVTFLAKGMNLNPPLAPFDGTQFYDQDSEVTVQLINSEGRCWSSVFLGPAIKNDVDDFKDKTP